ncbi:P1 family peptidase [Actomonas aquatica]|uniref:P1 family peptidase n=1 Tax=Actomonas aquatica TaxID=2866162 RepID=A0ABZ1C5U2_9BACT|nr:P1 family peptidase [Opitutus sp. WL0086]WRQ86733.1 P1 family peptidase [Opitutus sp. WL0086]
MNAPLLHVSRWLFGINLLIAPLLVAQTATPATGITAIPGIEVGHHTLSARATGCTVILARAGAVGGVDVRGGAPGTSGTNTLDPINLVDQVHAIVLTGGSAYGLASVDGVMRYLEDEKIGFEVGRGKVVPIVAGAVIFDLQLEPEGQRMRPDANAGYLAAQSASSATPAEGAVGAGAGATIGKLLGADRAMRGGFGTASITLPNGLIVAAAVVVNAAGDIVDPATGQIIAGARDASGEGFADMRQILRSGDQTADPLPVENTTIGVVATNAQLTKAQATKMAQMAQDGLARTTYPAHSMIDGDTVFSLATGGWTGPADVSQIGALAADVMTEAILRAVQP